MSIFKCCVCEGEDNACFLYIDGEVESWPAHCPFDEECSASWNEVAKSIQDEKDKQIKKLQTENERLKQDLSNLADNTHELQVCYDEMLPLIKQLQTENKKLRLALVEIQDEIMTNIDVMRSVTVRKPKCLIIAEQALREKGSEK